MIELPTMGSLGLPELIVILIIIIFLFGANRIPEIAKGIGSAIRNFKNEAEGKDASSGPRMATCPSCATVNEADSRFCRKCGTKLS
jgi:sec-independent protein translocase protein TatA